jgi:hypothetical protein
MIKPKSSTSIKDIKFINKTNSKSLINYQPYQIYRNSLEIDTKNEDEIINTVEDENAFFSVDLKNSKMIIKPNSKFKLIVDLISTILVLYQAFVIPFRACFTTNFTYGILGIFEIAQDFYFIFDIFISFNTGYIEQGVLILNRNKISLNYLRSWFLLDVISTFPYSLVISPTNYFTIWEETKTTNSHGEIIELLRVLKVGRYFRLARLFRVLKLKFLIQIINSAFDSKLMLIILEFIKILSILLIVSHWLSCIWFYISNYEYQEEFNSYDAYLNSFYFILISMVTIGFGDIVPHTANQRLFVIFVQIFSGIVFSLVMGSLGGLISRLNTKEYEELYRPNDVNKLLLNKGVSAKLRSSIEEYYEKQIGIQKLNVDQEMINLLNNVLRDEVMISLYHLFINNFLLISTQVEFTKYLLKELNEETFYPKEQIYQEGNFSNKCYFLSNGSVILYIPEIELIVQTISNFYPFGYIEFFGSLDRRLSAESIQYSQITTFDMNGFKKAAQLLYNNNNKEYISFTNYINDIKQAISKRELYEIDYTCSICGNDNHLLNECNNLYDKDKLLYMRTKSGKINTAFECECIIEYLNKLKLEENKYYDNNDEYTLIQYDLDKGSEYKNKLY